MGNRKRTELELLIERKHYNSLFDNTVAEATFKIIKAKFVMGKFFSNIESLRTDFFDYVNWFNNSEFIVPLVSKSTAEFRQLSAQEMKSIIF